jgi:hypothetical protein
MEKRVHFMIGALALSKFAFAESKLLAIWIAALTYSTFAILFAIVLFTHPKQAKDTGGK